MITEKVGSNVAHRVAVGAILSLWILGCSSVQAPPPEAPSAPPPTSVASSSIVPPEGQDLMVTLKTLLADPHAKPVMLGAGGLLAVLLLAVGLKKILRGNAPEAPSANGA